MLVIQSPAIPNGRNAVETAAEIGHEPLYFLSHHRPDLIGPDEAMSEAPRNREAQLEKKHLQFGAATIPAGPFSSWTADQQRVFPTELAQVCAAFWSFAHDAPDTKFLPASLSDGDEGELGLDVCLVSHMPVDWPGRAARLRSATAILARADQAGSSLHLPSEMRP